MPIRTGIDVTGVDRIQNVLKRYGGHFRERFFPHFEEQHDDTSGIPARTYAGLWAAKEAVFKAIGRGYRWSGVFIDHESSGRPYVRIISEEARLDSTIIPPDAEWDCSITHDADLALATATCYWSEGDLIS